MGAALLVASNNAGLAIATGTENPVGGGRIGNLTTESELQYTARIAGTLSKLGININATGTTRSITARVNGANGNETIAISDGASGWLEDASNTDSISAGDEIDITLAEAGTNPTVYCLRQVFTASSGHGCFYCASGTTAFALTGGGATEYIFPAGTLDTNSTSETNQKLMVRAAGTLTGGQININANTLGVGNTFTMQSRINGANGNIVVTVANGVTGIVEDTSNADTLADGDVFCFAMSISGGTGVINARVIGCAISNSSSANDVFAGYTSNNRAASATAHFLAIAGYNSSVSLTTESQAQIQHGFALTASRMRLWVVSNTYTGSATVISRVNAGNGNQTITIGAGVTGLVEDSSNSDTLAATDGYCMQITGGTAGSLVFNWSGMLETVTAAAVTLFDAFYPSMVNRSIKMIPY